MTLNDFTISTEASVMDVKFIHNYLDTQSYWAKDITLEIVQRSIDNSLNFGVFYKESQVGFARVIFDYATIAYLGDVFITEAFRGNGLFKLLMENIMQHSKLQGLRRWVLLTADAHELYKKFGWKAIEKPASYMEIENPRIYENK